MKWVLYTIGFLWIIWGVIQVLYTENSQKVLRLILKKGNPKILAILPLLFGVLLIITSFWSKAKIFIFILGILGCLKGVLFLLLPTKHTERFLNWWISKTSDQFLRFCGLLLVIIGMSIISWI